MISSTSCTALSLFLVGFAVVCLGSECGKLDFFTDEDYAEAKERLRMRGNENCIKLTKMKPLPFTLCTHDPILDYVASKFHSDILWESDIVEFNAAVLDAYGERAVFVDVGAGIGTKAVAAAKLGHKVWAVEPLDANLAMMYKNAKLNGVLDKVTMLKHSANYRDCLPTHIKPAKGNFEASMVQDKDVFGEDDDESNNHPTMRKETVSSLKLIRVFDDIKAKTRDRPIPVLLSIDTNGLECKALLGSAMIFSDRSFSIPYVLTKWYLMIRDEEGEPHYHEHCPKDMMELVVDMMVKNGYEPYEQLSKSYWLKQDPSDLMEVTGKYVMWKKKTARNEGIFNKVNDLYDV